MARVDYDTPDGTESYYCDETHTDAEPMLTALRYGDDGVEEKKQFPIGRVIRVVTSSIE